MMAKLHLIAVIATLGLAGPLAAASKSAAKPDDAKSDQQAVAPKKVRLKGQVVCLTEVMGKAYDIEFPSGHEHRYGFKTTDDHVYTLFRNRFSKPLFVEESLQQKTLVITGKVLPRSNILTVDKIRSIHDGKLHDVYYYCDVCAIKAVEPGPCMCCQQPVELVEKPVE